MKNKLLKVLVLLLYVLTWVSCSEDDITYKNPSWKQDVKITGKLGVNKFKVNINEVTGISGWSSESADIDLDLDWGSDPENPITKVDIYINVQEQLEEGSNMVGGTTGKLIRTITEFDPSGKFSLTITTDEIYALFENDFLTERTELSHTDLFELDWVITHSTNETFDSRECFDVFCQFGFKPEVKLVDIWAGTFNYKYIEAGSGESYYGIGVGTTGTMNLTKISNGVFSFPHLLFYGYPYGNYSGKINYNSTTGGISLVYVGQYAIWDEPQWEIISISGDVLTIKWTYYWTNQYDEWGTVEFKRTDGLDWPTNIHME